MPIGVVPNKRKLKSDALDDKLLDRNAIGIGDIHIYIL